MLYFFLSATQAQSLWKELHNNFVILNVQPIKK